jgi:hypothetical protein
MASIDYNRQLLGFVVRDSAISQVEWVAFASSHPAFRKEPPVNGINPFTRQPMQFRNTNFTFVQEGRVVSLVVWEEAECIGVAGDAVASTSLISLLCDTFHARFEAIESDR